MTMLRNTILAGAAVAALSLGACAKPAANNTDTSAPMAADNTAMSTADNTAMNASNDSSSMNAMKK